MSDAEGFRVVEPSGSGRRVLVVGAGRSGTTWVGEILGLAKDTPAGRPTATGSAVESKIRSFPRLGGLHHRYAVAA